MSNYSQISTLVCLLKNHLKILLRHIYPNPKLSHALINLNSDIRVGNFILEPFWFSKVAPQDTLLRKVAQAEIGLWRRERGDRGPGVEGQVVHLHRMQSDLKANAHRVNLN